MSLIHNEIFYFFQFLGIYGQIVEVQVLCNSAMVIVRSKQCIIALLTASALVFVYYTANFSRLSVATVKDTVLHTTEDREQLFTNWTTISASEANNVVLPASFDYRNETFDCKTVVLMDMKFPVCHYTAKTDDTVSGFLLRGIYFEADEIKRFLRLFHLDRQLQMIDIGANVGLYSLPAARVTKVIAVEPNWHSMARLVKAVDLGGISSNITLIHNAVSNVRATFHMGVHPRNQGNAFLINTAKCKATPINLPCNTLSPIRTILLNDLLPLMRSKAALMKVDVEGHEINVFTNPSAGQFFDQVDIPLIFMEWNLCKRHPVHLVQRLLDFFYSRNYAVFELNNFKLKKHYLSWPDNVLFKKLTYLRF